MCGWFVGVFGEGGGKISLKIRKKLLPTMGKIPF